MLVIHPNDKRTSLARAIYADLKVRLVQQEQFERGKSYGKHRLKTPSSW